MIGILVAVVFLGDAGSCLACINGTYVGSGRVPFNVMLVLKRMRDT